MLSGHTVHIQTTQEQSSITTTLTLLLLQWPDYCKMLQKGNLGRQQKTTRVFWKNWRCFHVQYQAESENPGWSKHIHHPTSDGYLTTRSTTSFCCRMELVTKPHHKQIQRVPYGDGSEHRQYFRLWSCSLLANGTECTLRDTAARLLSPPHLEDWCS